MSKKQGRRGRGGRSSSLASSDFVDPPLFPGLGRFTKTLHHNDLGEVVSADLNALYAAASVRRTDSNAQDAFARVPRGTDGLGLPGRFASASLVNPLAGLATDPLVPASETFRMPPPPSVDSIGSAAEMTELYWMALLRDVPFDSLTASATPDLADCVTEIDSVYRAANNDNAPGALRRGIDLPDGPVSETNVFRMGLPGESNGPLVSQFFLRDVGFGTQTIDQRQSPYAKDMDYLTTFDEWLHAQRTGRGSDGAAYPGSNERHPKYFAPQKRHISSMRDLARFVNKDALHQAYFNAALLLLSGGADWNPGNPYFPDARRDAGFGVLGGPHILALVSEVATRGLQTIWFQKWQTWLRHRPESYGGKLHVQEIGVNGQRRAYGLRADGNFGAEARRRIKSKHGGSLLLPMAFTAGSPVHPAYGAGHATVAGACVTVLKAYFRTLDATNQPIPLLSLRGMAPCVPGINPDESGSLRAIDDQGMTIEGELNKLASNVAMGRSMGGVHWRTDNTRSLVLGEALAVHMLATIAREVAEKPTFTFRTFGRRNGAPGVVTVSPTGVTVDGTAVALSSGGVSLSSLL